MPVEQYVPTVQNERERLINWVNGNPAHKCWEVTQLSEKEESYSEHTDDPSDDESIDVSQYQSEEDVSEHSSEDEVAADTPRTC